MHNRASKICPITSPTLRSLLAVWPGCWDVYLSSECFGALQWRQRTNPSVSVQVIWCLLRGHIANGQNMRCWRTERIMAAHMIRDQAALHWYDGEVHTFSVTKNVSFWRLREDSNDQSNHGTTLLYPQVLLLTLSWTDRMPHPSQRSRCYTEESTHESNHISYRIRV